MKKIALLLAGLGCASVNGVQQAQEYGPMDLYNKIELEGTSVFISRQVSNNLSYFYEGLDREMPLCMFGVNNEHGYFIRRVGFPFYLASDSVSSALQIGNCNEDPSYLGIVHNHPLGTCDPSYVDMVRFIRDEKSILEMIICGTDLTQEMINIGVVKKEDLEG